MTLFQVFLFLHIAGVIVWVGTGLAMELLTWRIEQNKDPGRLRDFLATNTWLSGRVFAPAGILTLVMGISMVAISSKLQFSQLWIILGFVGLFVAIGVGAGLVGKTSERVMSLLQNRGFDDREVQQQLWRLNFYSLLHTALMTVIILDMVAKPTVNSLSFFAVAAIIMVAAAVWGWRGRPAESPNVF